MMNTPYWELSILSRAVDHLNLSAASAHIGLSQPQLSRIIARIESELGVVLLDRSVRRRSTWTPEARKIAEIYKRSDRGLQAEVTMLAASTRPTRIAVGCLEGLIELAAGVCHTALARHGLVMLELDVHDIDTLESRFLGGTLDVVYTCREIVRRKPKFARVIASQRMDVPCTDETVAVRSHYEHQSIPLKRGARPPYSRLILSNSLTVRKHWIEHYGGKGVVPSAPQRTSQRNPRMAPVYLFATDRLAPEIWQTFLGQSEKKI